MPLDTKPIPETVRETAKLLWFQGVRPELISKRLGVKRGTLRTWNVRYGWNKAVEAAKGELRNMAIPALVADTTRTLQAESEELRGMLANEIRRTAGALSQVPTGKGLRPLKERTEVLEPLARTAKTVFDWGSDVSVGIIAMNVVNQGDSEPEVGPVIDVTAEPVGESGSEQPGR